MANITLKIDDDLLQKARQLAGKRKTSINAIVRQRIVEFIESDLGPEAAIKGIDAFYLRCKARVGKRKWDRDEIHER